MESAIQPAPTTQFLWDADRYEEAVARGVFTPEDPIELIDGELVTYMSPQLSPHATSICLTASALGEIFREGFIVRQQLPLRLGARSVPEPDIAVVGGTFRDFVDAHPRTAELLVEIADSSLAFDRGRKLRLYARERIPEYWIVNLADDCVETFRSPEGEAYRESRVFRRGEKIPAGPTASLVAVDDLLP